ncbi:MAG TPA: thiamine-phosphate kinase [Silvibacterium sp.]|nr:thiamine-phosphate kinase [Silvibacterium sp.]
MSESELIAAIRGRALGGLNRRRGSGSGLRVGIGDDCAILRVRPDEELVVTTDFSLEGVHFRREWHSPESVGHKCLARGLSDVAAMGARPVAAFLSLAVPEEWGAARRGGSSLRRSWVSRFFDGLLALAESYEVPLAGGDTARAADGACFDIVVLGAVKRGRAWLRSGAKAGDAIYVTGALGGAAAELVELERSKRKFAGLRTAAAGHPHLFPEPRLGVAARLAALGRVHSAIDVSDGLSTDLAHVCEESGLAAELDAAAIPVHALAVEAQREGRVGSALDLALHGGDDYELLFTAAAGARIPRRVAGVEVRRIGRMVRGRPRLWLKDESGRREIEARGWEHFGKSPLPIHCENFLS